MATRGGVAVGDVLGLDSSGNAVKADASVKLLGVYSPTPATLGNWKDGWENDKSLVPVGLLGQLPVQVSMENGTITAGDFLTISSTPGVAMKANKSGHAIGKALQSTESDGTILAFVSTEYYTTEELLKSSSDDVRTSVTTLSATYDELFDKYGADLEEYVGRLDEAKEDVAGLKKDVKNIQDIIAILTLTDERLKVDKDMEIAGDISLDSATVLDKVAVGDIEINAKVS